ncbi:MAG: HD domain-containing protein [Spirochaetaceae bacterium]|jgi:exopolyphosphatase/guanosine-5'-triphosphate,3'-diphosphate pyrophosphatase|nr:HD domain-containing protein [Spirochaetaceae bacterium]
MNLKNHPAAIIEIGSTGIRVLVAEVSMGLSSEVPADSWRIRDQAGKPVSLGRDVFTSGMVSRESVLECLSVLQNYRELIRGWGVAQEDVHVIGTSALRAARNRDLFADRVYHETGFRINIIEGIEETRLMYLAVRYALKNDLPLFRRANSMILEVGGGSTEIMLLRRGKMVAAHSLKLGTIRMDQLVHQASDSAAFQSRYLNENVRNTAEALKTEMDLTYIRSLVISGSGSRIMAMNIGREFNKDCRIVPRKLFMEFTERVKNYTVEECVREFEIPYSDAEDLIPGILIYRLFLEHTAAGEIVVPLVSIREGMLINLVSQVDSGLQEEFYSQVIASAVNLGRKYHFDEAHNRHVAQLSMTLFDALRHEHGMNRRDRLLLEVAGTLHDVGMYIRSSAHQKHGQYIVAHSEIFGLHQGELDIISNVICYHRGEPPSEADIDYIALQREDRLLVLKMAAILRVADCLDRGHSRHIRKISVERQQDMVVLRPSEIVDTSIERLGLEDKGVMFQDVFGYRVLLV